MTEQPSYDQIKSEALAALAAGEAHTAFQNFRPCLEYGSDILTDDKATFIDAFAVFTRISQAIAGDEFTEKISLVAQQPNDVQALYELGYALYEESLFGIAAGVLSRADQVEPGNPGVVSELVCALEGFNRCDEAVSVLRRYPELTDTQFVFSYLLAYNCLMSGDLQTTASIASKMPPLVDEENHDLMAQRIYDFLARAQRIGDVSPLDDDDLRGWNYVTTGGILTTLSEFGFPEPMRGRFAYLQDSYEYVHRGLLALQRIVESKNIKPEALFALPGRSSLIVATAASQLFDLPLKGWPEQGTEQAGIIVGYDFGEIDVELAPLAEHHPNQLLFSHAVQWTFGLPIAPDVVTLQHQMLVPRWEKQLSYGVDDSEPTEVDADTRSADLIAQDILKSEPAKLDPANLEEGETLPPELSDAFLDAIGQFPPEAGRRQNAWPNSPVKSARFG